MGQHTWCRGWYYLGFLVFLCSLLSQYTFSSKIVWHMSFICNLEHWVDSVITGTLVLVSLRNAITNSAIMAIRINLMI